MRIVMFSWESLHSIFMGGLGVHATELAAALDRRGHEIHLITRRRETQSEYEQIDGVHDHRVDHGVDFDFIKTMDMMCQSMAHRYHEITAMVGNVELVHAHDWLTGLALKYVQEGYGTRGVLTMHSTEYGRDANAFYEGYAADIRDVEAQAVYHADEIIAVSRFLADEVARIYHVPYEKMHNIHNGIAYHAFDGFVDPAEVKARYGIGAMQPTIFAAGRMTRQKGMDMLIEAVPLVLGYHPEAKFVISGSGPEFETVVGKANELGVQDNCVFLPAMARQEYIDMMRACDIVAMPSRNEPFGIVALEGWAAGKPVVATNAGGPAEFIWHDVNGFLVDANPGGLAYGIGSLLADFDHCRALGANGRRAVEETYNWDNVAAWTEGVYELALNKDYAGA
jgi:glycosyltransferase involved in cell wall biosynthesis